MDNLTAVKSLSNAIVSTFYPDIATIEMVLFNEGIDAQAEAIPKDIQIFRVALHLVFGYVESSRAEGGISVSTLPDTIRQSILFWCNYYGLNAEEELNGYVRTLESGTHLW